METQKAIEILREHNRWRRGEGKYDQPGITLPYSPKEIGIAIDVVTNELEELIKPRSIPTSAMTDEDIRKMYLDIASEIDIRGIRINGRIPTLIHPDFWKK